MYRVLPLIACVSIAVLLQSCARSVVLPISANTIQITTSAAPVCGATGAQGVALRRAAIETINRGFDRFVVLGADARNNVGVIGYTPTTATTVGSGTLTGFGNSAVIQGSSTTTYSGGDPIIAGTHDQTLVIRMFKDADPGAANAVSARATLGDDWQEQVKQSIRTCVQ